MISAAMFHDFCGCDDSLSILICRRILDPQSYLIVLMFLKFKITIQIDTKNAAMSLIRHYVVFNFYGFQVRSMPVFADVCEVTFVCADSSNPTDLACLLTAVTAA